MARLPYADQQSVSPHVARVLDRVPARLNVFRMVAHAETALVPWLRYGAALLSDLELDPVLRELAILEVARACDCEYERVQHEAIALAVGCDEQQVRAVAAGEDEQLGPRERAVVRFTREVADDVGASAATLEALREHLSDREVVELLLVAGHYMGIARLARTTGLDIDAAAGLAVVGREA
jgi:AhpD family alkylhydroperoxidase